MLVDGGSDPVRTRRPPGAGGPRDRAGSYGLAERAASRRWVTLIAPSGQPCEENAVFGTSIEDVTCIEDMREIARRRVPRAFFQYADHGSYTQSTLRANRADLDGIKLRQRVGIDVGLRDLSTTIAGEPASLPLALAPG